MTEPDEFDRQVLTLCPQHGINVEIDEKGCCVTCGAWATGDGVLAVAAALRELARAKDAENGAEVSHWAQAHFERGVELDNLRAQLAAKDAENRDRGSEKALD
jgi:hypothetical protein